MKHSSNKPLGEVDSVWMCRNVWETGKMCGTVASLLLPHGMYSNCSLWISCLEAAVAAAVRQKNKNKKINVWPHSTDATMEQQPQWTARGRADFQATPRTPKRILFHAGVLSWSEYQFCWPTCVLRGSERVWCYYSPARLLYKSDRDTLSSCHFLKNILLSPIKQRNTASCFMVLRYIFIRARLHLCRKDSASG